MDLQAINEQEKRWLLKEKYGGISSDKYLAECKLIDNGMPVAYLIGNIEFLGCHIDLSSKPLIPRAETEYWVNHLIQEHKGRYSKQELQNMRVLDIFAGSGCVGIALAKHFGCHIDFAELRPEHCKQIKKNLDTNFNPEEQSRFTVIESDVLTSVPKKEYDLIVANPPYVPMGQKDLVQDSVQKYEDKHAVFAEDNGNALIKKMVDSLDTYLKPGSSVYIEYDPSQTKTLLQYIEDRYSAEVLSDQYNRERILVLKSKKKV